MRQLVLLLPLACTAYVDPTAARPASETPPTAPSPADVRAPAPAIATCPIEQPRPQPLELDAVSDIGVAAGKTWHVAMAAGNPVLLHLDATGALVQHKLPAWTEEVAAEGDARLRLFYPATARWSLVDLRSPDAPAPGPLAPLPGLVPGEYPKAVASDGTRALVSLYRANPEPDGERYVGDTVLLDVATGERKGPRADMTVWTAECHAGACWGVATVNGDPGPHALVALDDAGARRIDAIGGGECSGLATWRDGQDWLIAWSEKGAVGLAAAHLTTGGHSLSRLRLDTGDCAEFEHLALPGRHGLVVTTGERRVFVPVRPTLGTDPPERLPPFDHRQQKFLAVGDGVLVADFEAAAGLQKDRTPDPEGKYEYDEVWRFAGRHRFLRPAREQWTADPPAPLPHDGEEGKFSRGYEVHLLARPGHAGVLLAGDGEPSVYLPLRRSCP